VIETFEKLIPSCTTQELASILFLYASNNREQIEVESNTDFFESLLKEILKRDLNSPTAANICKSFSSLLYKSDTVKEFFMRTKERILAERNPQFPLLC